MSESETLTYTQTERHDVIITKTMEISVNDIIESGITVDQFKEYLIDQDSCDEEILDICHDLIFSLSDERCRDEDWVSDNKGYTDYLWELNDE